MQLKFSAIPVKIHLRRPEAPFVDPVTGKKVSFKYIEQHWIPKGKGTRVPIICGTVEGKPCVPCAYTNPQKFDELGDVDPIPYIVGSQLNPGYVVEGWVESWFHSVDEVNEKSGKTYKVREPCKGQKCQHCNKRSAKVFGRRFFSVMSDNAWNVVFDRTDQELRTHCKCSGRIYYPEWKCPECNTILLNPAAECTCGSTKVEFVVGEDGDIEAECDKCHKSWGIYPFNDEQLAAEIEEKVKCPECKKRVFIVPVEECTKCKDPEPLTIYDAQLKVRKASTDDKAPLLIESWKIAEPDQRLFNGDYQGDDAVKEVERMKAHIDLDANFSAKSTNEQATAIGEKDPFVTRERGSKVSQYNRGSRHDHDEDDSGYDDDGGDTDED